MSEEVKNKEEEEVIHLQVERHQWPDEVEMKTLRREHKHLMILIYVLAILCGLLGGLAWSMRRRVLPGTAGDSTKFDEAMRIMTKEWFFASEIEDPEGRMMDQALTGMTTNEEDPHTEYMSKEETESFMQSINRNFVGIGVQYFSTGDGIHMVERVFKGSPAEEAGVLPGDLIHIVDGVVVDDLTSTEVTDMVRGSENTNVEIDFIRGDETVHITIPRRPINVTVFGEMLEEKTGYIEIMQFGETTGDEMSTYLKDLIAQGAEKLIIDLRGNGGGYLEALRKVASLFVPKNTVLMKQVYADGSEEVLRAIGGQLWDEGEIILLVDSDTASASEVFTLALTENRDDVRTVGTTTYGKGTVQITYTFSDSSALKYTTGKWVSPKDVWVNHVGIEPDYKVELHPVLKALFPDMEEGNSTAYDSVSEYNRIAQMALDYLGYPIERTDGYFSAHMQEVITSFQHERGLEENGILDRPTYNSLIGAVIYDWNTTKIHDNVLMKAEELLHE